MGSCAMSSTTSARAKAVAVVPSRVHATLTHGSRYSSAQVKVRPLTSVRMQVLELECYRSRVSRWALTQTSVAR